MLDPARYFDHAATTPLAPEVLREMEPYLGLAGNAHSIHAFGRRAGAAVDLARGRVAELIEAEDPSQVVFTSGATEACNAVLAMHEGGWVSPFEHVAVREPALARGYRVMANEILEVKAPNHGLPPKGGKGGGGPAYREPLDPTPAPPHGEGILCLMAVNNEIGAVWNVRDLPAERRFADATQALGKISYSVDGLDYAAFSAHKLYGPQGVGAIYAADAALDPFVKGGDQEEGRRAGTLNVAGIVGFGAACALAADRLEADHAHAAELRALVLDELRSLSDWRVNGGEDAVPHILSLSLAGLEGETLVIEADRVGFALSAGAACSSRSTEPSHVLVALGVGDLWRRGTVRISFGRANTPETARDLGRNLVRSAEKLRTIA